MNKLHISATLKIHKGKIEHFKEVANRCVKRTREKDTGTLQYDWFLNPEESVCKVRETYASPEAALKHGANLSDLIQELLSLCDATIELFGNPSPEVLQAVASVLQQPVYRTFEVLNPS